MNDPESFDHLPRAAVFAEVARTSSFGRAAAALGLSRSTVSHHVQALERALGVRLIERTTRRMRLTQEGELLHEGMKVALAAWLDATAAVTASRAAPSGTLRVTAPSGLSSAVARAGSTLIHANEQVNFELVTSDEVVDLVSRGLDLAVRMTSLPDSSLVATKLLDTPLILVASPRTSRSLGTLEHAIGHVGYVAHDAVYHGHLELFEGGVLRRIPVTPRATANNTESQLALVEASVGFSLVPEVLAQDQLREGRLVHVWPALSGRTWPVYAVRPTRRFVPARVSCFLPLLRAELDRHR